MEGVEGVEGVEKALECRTVLVLALVVLVLVLVLARVRYARACACARESGRPHSLESLRAGEAVDKAGGGNMGWARLPRARLRRVGVIMRKGKQDRWRFDGIGMISRERSAW